MLARALSAECSAALFVVKPSDMLSCYVGDSEKFAACLFSYVSGDILAW